MHRADRTDLGLDSHLVKSGCEGGRRWKREILRCTLEDLVAEAVRLAPESSAQSVLFAERKRTVWELAILSTARRKVEHTVAATVTVS